MPEIFVWFLAGAFAASVLGGMLTRIPDGLQALVVFATVVLTVVMIAFGVPYFPWFTGATLMGWLVSLGIETGFPRQPKFSDYPAPPRDREWEKRIRDLQKKMKDIDKE